MFQNILQRPPSTPQQHDRFVENSKQISESEDCNCAECFGDDECPVGDQDDLDLEGESLLSYSIQTSDDNVTSFYGDTEDAEDDQLEEDHQIDVQQRLEVGNLEPKKAQEGLPHRFTNLKFPAEPSWVCPGLPQSFANLLLLTERTSLVQPNLPQSLPDLPLYPTKPNSSQPNLQPNLLPQPSSPAYQCPYCFKHFLLQDFYLIHIRSHTSPTPLTCIYCSKSFNKTKDLVRHERCHTNTRPYSCPLCFVPFQRNDHLLRHVRVVHQKYRGKIAKAAYQCSLCSLSFTNKASFDDHRRRHLLRPFSCELCDKSYAYNSGLYLHRKRKHT